MLKKWNIRAVVCLFMMCMFLGGCGEKEGTILIGSGEDSGSESQETESIKAANDSVQPGQSEGAEGTQETFIRVYVCGAVASPGVVEIPAGSRAEDALTAAGGFGADAAREAVNLAEWVSDGQMLYFPTKEEARELKTQEAQTAAGVVNINTADVAALCTLPGVGESRAADIIAYREANGRFESCEDIMKVTGIKTALYEKIKDKIIVK